MHLPQFKVTGWIKILNFLIIFLASIHEAKLRFKTKNAFIFALLIIVNLIQTFCTVIQCFALKIFPSVIFYANKSK